MIASIPFPTTTELHDELALASNLKDPPTTTTEDPAFLPGEPWLSLDPSNESKLCSFLKKELETPNVDRLYPYLWLVATQRSDHISALHDQIVKGRKIIVSENPEIHLTWMYDRIYIKPMPLYLLSSAFWQHYLCSDNSPLQDLERDRAKASACGFLRSYFYLIQHASDHRIALEHHLIPEDIQYTRLRQFLSCFESISDEDVTPRYKYGQLRLRRINFWGRIFLRKFTFQKDAVHYSYSTYFARVYGPVLFVFAFFSTTLSAMQVGLGTTELTNGAFHWYTLLCRWYSMATLLVAFICLACILSLLVYMILRELAFALRAMYRKSRQLNKGEGIESGKRNTN